MTENLSHLPNGDAAIRPTAATTWSESIQRTLTAALIIFSIGLIAALLPDAERPTRASASEVASISNAESQRDRAAKVRVRETRRARLAAFRW